MITRILIEHYKSIDRVDLPLGPLSILVGPNGTGKSNFIDAVRFVRDAVSFGLDRSVSERHGIDSIRQWSPSRPYYVTLRAEVENRYGKGFLSFALTSYRGSHTIRREEAMWSYHRDTGYSQVHYTRDAEGGVQLKDLENRSIKTHAEQPEELFLAQFEARHLRGLVHALGSMEAYSIYPNILRTPQKSSSDTTLSQNGDNLTSVYRLLTKSKRQDHVKARNEIVSAMRKVMPNLDSIRIQSLGGLMVPVFRVREQDGRLHDFNVAQLSDGTLRVLGLLTALYQPYRPDILAMEEPEQTINPGVLAVLAEAIEETSSTSQVMVTTHSPELLDKFDDPGVVMAVEMENGVTRIGPINEDQRDAVRDRLFSLGELMSMEGLHV